MKLWMKIFISALVLFEIVFGIGTMIMLSSSFNQSLQREVDLGLSEQATLHAGLRIVGNLLVEDFEEQEESGIQFDDFLKVSFKNYIELYSTSNMFVEIRDSNNTVLVSNLKLEVPQAREELSVTLSERRNYILRDVGKSSFLFITNLLPIGEKEYKLTYIRDITEVYESRKGQFVWYLCLNIGASVVLGGILFLLLRHFMEPMRRLISSAKKIRAGEYEQRVKINSTDEVGELSDAFNHMAEAVEEKIGELNQQMQGKEAFIRSLSHEMKTPLTSIIGYTELLRDAKYNEEYMRKGMNYIHSEAKRLETLSFKLMELQLLNKQDFHLQEEDMVKVWEELQEWMTKRFQEKGLHLRVGTMEGKAVIEKDLFKMVLTNILDNAVKASYEGGTIEVGMQRTDGFSFFVKDFGIGIPEEELGQIIEPFYMVDKSRTRKNNGAGLGLSICNEILKLHKGNMQIESSLGNGTTVTIHLP